MQNQVEAGRNGCLNLVKAGFNPWIASITLERETNDISRVQLVAHAEDKRKLTWHVFVN